VTRLIAALLALALAATGGCDARQEIAASGSVTVKLPPARPALSAPGFSFRSASKPHRSA
jgi:hypothetical protein